MKIEKQKQVRYQDFLNEVQEVTNGTLNLSVDEGKKIVKMLTGDDSKSCKIS